MALTCFYRKLRRRWGLKEVLLVATMGFAVLCEGTKPITHNTEVPIQGKMPLLPVEFRLSESEIDIFIKNVVMMLANSNCPLCLKVTPDSQKDGKGALHREGDDLPLPYEVYANRKEMPPETEVWIAWQGNNAMNVELRFVPTTSPAGTPAGHYVGHVTISVVAGDPNPAPPPP
ncbi:MAG: hypothetical protein LBJ70_05095 [Holosporales bacterium]|jgi:hypothetical protein|nr:hypothetical protein [Holosporales bacterium]